MNLGIYVNSLANENEMSFVSNIVNFAVDNNHVKDCSIFYDGIGFIPFDIPCGMFNSTDLWNFSGELLVLHSDCVKSALNIVNKINIFYHYGWNDNITLFNLLHICNTGVKVIPKTEKDKNNLYRLTGIDTQFISNSEDIINLLGNKS